MSLPPPELPAEIRLTIGKMTDPKTIRNLRLTHKDHRKLITDRDLVWTEAGWRYFSRGVNNCCYWAVRKGHAWVLELYISEMEIETSKLGLMLTVAANKGFGDIARMLLTAGHTEIGARGDALKCAVKGGHISIVRLLLEAGCLELWEIKWRSRESLEAGVKDVVAGALLRAVESVKKTRVSIMKLLLQTPYAQRDLDLALLSALQYGKPIEIIRLLVGAGASVCIRANERDRDMFDQSPLCAAVETNNMEIVKFLLKAGADVDNRPLRSTTPLITAAQNGHEDMFRLLLEAGANPCRATRNLISEIVRGGSVQILKMMMRANGKAMEAASPDLLVTAAGRGNAGMVEALLTAYVESGKNPEVYGSAAALNVARDGGHFEVVERLLQEEFAGKKGNQQ
ncbi:hypothetical protein HDV00_007584 [Rhizophlyctis rosea]|nr:hypothetical protein HDV00_007584 [Rhizophlyctis rosea]